MPGNGWVAVMKRRRHGNGIITGYRRGEWWIGARQEFACDTIVIGLFGFTCIIPNELLIRGTTTRTMRHSRQESEGD